ncbi:MAG: 50S ribosomal protein L15 [Patescibacteria group bacterium]
MTLGRLPKTTAVRKRPGRGTASGYGKTAGRGTKGQKSRAGHHYMPVRFEGGQMPLTQRLPKLRGFKNHGQQTAAVSVARLADRKLSGAVDLGVLKQAGLAPRDARRLKVFGNGTAPKISLTADAVTGSAEKAIKQAGGSVKLPASKPDTESSNDAR